MGGSGRARSVGELARAGCGPAFKRFGFAQAHVVARWAEIVGPEFARRSAPEAIRFPAGERAAGTLYVACEGAFAPCLAMVEGEIISRVNRLFGYGAVARMRLRHGSAPSPREVAEPPPPPAPATMTAGLRDVADPGLRASLEALAARVAVTRGVPVFDPDGARG